MIIEQTIVNDVKGSAFEAKVSSIDSSNSAKLFRILSGLYSDIRSSIIREYVSNALDSTVKAGTNEPILVDIQEDKLTIQDFGTGLSEEEMFEIYINFLTSTKENDNSAIGCMGLGSKCALNYQDSFSIISTKDELTTHYLYFKNENGLPELNKLIQVETTEANGVKIVIDLKSCDSDYFYGAVEKQLFYFPNVYLTGYSSNYNDRFNNRGYTDYEDFYISKEARGLNVTMGGVIYELNSNLLKPNTLRYFQGMSIKFEIGEITPTPSRESIDYTSSNIKKINDKISLIEKKLLDLFKVAAKTDTYKSTLKINYNDKLFELSTTNNFLNHNNIETHLASLDITWSKLMGYLDGCGFLASCYGSKYDKRYITINEVPIVMGKSNAKVSAYLKESNSVIFFFTKSKYKELTSKFLVYAKNAYYGHSFTNEEIKTLKKVLFTRDFLKIITVSEVEASQDYQDYYKKLEIIKEESVRARSNVRNIVVNYSNKMKESLSYLDLSKIFPNKKVVLLDSIGEYVSYYRHFTDYQFISVAPRFKYKLLTEFQDRFIVLTDLEKDHKAFSKIRLAYFNSMSYSDKTINLIKYLDKSLHKELKSLRQTNSFDMNILTAKIGETRLIDQKTIDKCLLRHDRVKIFNDYVNSTNETQYSWWSFSKFEIIRAISYFKFKRVRLELNYNLIHKLK